MAKESRMAQVVYRVTRENTGKAHKAACKAVMMAYQVMFSGQDLDIVQKAAVQYVETVPDLKVSKVLVKLNKDGALVTICLVKREPKE